jgi:GNAT superfamily N-acetyltransferase
MTRDIGAILLWLPPEKRLSAFNIFTLYNSGFLSVMLPWHYGLTGLHRVLLVFEENIHKMWSRTLPDLPPHGFKEGDCGFVQMLAANPKFAGKRYASALLDYQVRQHFVEFPDRPVILDTTTLQGIRAYERLGFRLLAETPVETGTDAGGIRLKKDASEEVKREAREVCVQRIMAKLPGGTS